MKIALLTHYVPTSKDDYSQLAALTVPNRDEWCSRHGYQHIVQRGPYKDAAMYYAFDRLVLLRELLDKPDAPDFVWVLNVQAVITNLTRQLEDFLDGEHSFWVTKDCHGINLGSFIARNTDWTKRWLDFIIAHEPAYRAADWKEQKVVQDWWMHEDWTWKIHLLPQRAINSYLYQLYPPWPPETPGNWRPGDLALNLPGTTLQQRLDIVRQVLQSDMIVR